MSLTIFVFVLLHIRHWEEVELWLRRRNLSEFIPVFGIEGSNGKMGIEGDQLLELDLAKMYDDPWNADLKLNIKQVDKEHDPRMEVRYISC